jgi:Cu+-exporting ATPase
MSAHLVESDQTAAAAPAPARTELRLAGLTCGNCVRRVTEAIASVPGVSRAAVTLERGRASVHWAAHAPANVAAVLQAVKGAGYEAQVLENASSAALDHGGGWHTNLWIGVVGAASLLLGDWVFGLGSEPWFRWASFGLAAIVQSVAGARFYAGAWAQLKVGSSNMDTLVALGSTTAFAYSAWALFAAKPGHLYFMDAAAIIALISVGHWLEARVSARASSALKKLLHLAPALARRRNADGTELELPVEELQLRDTVLLRPGDCIPTDGEVLEGESVVDESMLTGESVPVEKAAKSKLYAGTVNLDGRLLMQVTAIGEATALARVIAAVERAQTSRANIQRLGDRVSNVFVPVVVLLAIATALWWGLMPDTALRVTHWLATYLWPVHPPDTPLAAAIVGAAAVLIIACPCAMGLATPAAIMAGSNAAAARGILIRDAIALEKAGRISSVLFDKTGTLTVGKPEVVKFASMHDGAADARPLASTLPAPLVVAAALARPSNHPLSQAVAQMSAEEFDLTAWKEVRGAGVEAKWRKPEGNPIVRLGSLKWLRELDVDLSAGQDFVAAWSAPGATILGLAQDRSLLGLFALQDALKPGARKVVERLNLQGMKTFLVTGDLRLTAVNIAGQAGIPAENVFAEVRPEQKAEFVQQLQRQGERVAFVGDGINDAPALEQADLGIAVGRASDIAREAADILLLRSDIEAVPESLGLARATLRAIKQNLFWAFFYNAAGVPLAALGFLSPVLCAAAMGLSDLIVLGNALRLRRWKLRG